MTLREFIISLGLTPVAKADSTFMKVLNAIFSVFLFIPNLFLSDKISFRDGYITTIGATMYCCPDWWARMDQPLLINDKLTVMHEKRHHWQSIIWGWRFFVYYIVSFSFRMHMEAEAIAIEAAEIGYSAKDYWPRANFKRLIYVLPYWQVTIINQIQHYIDARSH